MPDEKKDPIRAQAAALDAELRGDPPAVLGDAGPGQVTSPDAAGLQIQADADAAREWAQFPALFGGILAQAMPELADAYSEANCLAWGEAMVPVAKKYQWTTASFGGWVGLAGATWTFAKPTFDAIRARRTVKPKPAPAPGAPAVPADASSSSTPETAVATRIA